MQNSVKSEYRAPDYKRILLKIQKVKDAKFEEKKTITQIRIDLKKHNRVGTTRNRIISSVCSIIAYVLQV